MPERPLAEHVDMLEKRVDVLELLPARMASVESQILQLRNEMRREFLAVREEIHKGDEETRRYMRVLHEEVIERIATIQEGFRRRRK